MNWQEVIQKYPEANFLQSPNWGIVNEKIGKKIITSDFDGNGYALMIVHNAKRGRYLEIPCGPLLNWQDQKATSHVISSIQQIAKANRCIFVRLRPQLPATPKNLALLKTLGLKKSPMHLAAEHTVILNLEKSEAELLSEMRRQTRYDVRRAEKLGITVSSGNSETTFKEFHKVQTATAKRQNFIPPNLKTLIAEKEAFKDESTIYIAKDSAGQPIAYGLIIWSGLEADYYEAASTELNHKLPGAYALIWQVIKDMKQKGLKRLNLWGIAPKNQPHHRYAGVTTFKTGFGGEIIEFVPAHDLIINKIKYLPNFIVETTRRKKRHL